MRDLIVLFCGLLLLWACSEEPDCNLDLGSNTVFVNFYDIEDSSELFLKFVQIRERSSDSTFYTSEDSLSSFAVALNPDNSTVTYVFIGSTDEDTLSLGYSKELRWISESCSPSFYYDELEVIGSSFTHELSSTTIDVSIDENIKVYR
ncbi:MAG: DUF6452 family protein [Reichenbachiella sp.]|uniref:DUF6452 family protein n=1 Tax=Reichenbachiella sp. TaxID=2184521 RepID=UPI0032671A85